MPTDDETTKARVCSVCRTTLDRWQPKDPSEPETWRHTLTYINENGEPDHEADPVPLAEFTHTNPYCDFCSSLTISATYQFAELSYGVLDQETNEEVVVGNMSAGWAACSQCARLIDAHNINGLVARAVKAFKHNHGTLSESMKANESAFEAGIDDLYRKLMRGWNYQKSDVHPNSPYSKET